MANIILLLFCFAAGIALRALGRFPDNAPASLNAFIINIGLPALSLAYLNGLELTPQLAVAALAPWAMFLLALAVLWPACRLAGLSRPSTGCVILVGGLGNTSFLGLPLIEAYYGPDWVGLGIVMDQIGSYLVLAVLGIAVARLFAAGPRPRAGDILRRVVSFPPFLATLAALALIDATYPAWLATLLDRLAATVAPMALVSVGLQLRLSSLAGRFGALALGLGFKLLLGPLLMLGLLLALLPDRGTGFQVTVFELAMAPMIGASIVAMENDLDPQLATLLVGLGVPLSFLTLAGWHQLLALL